MDKIACRLSSSVMKRSINSRSWPNEGLNLFRRTKSNTTSNFVKVAVVGAAGTIGQSLSLMLKQSPYVDELSLYDDQSLESFAADLNFVDTKCRVRSFNGKKFIKKALENSSVVVVLTSPPHSETLPPRALLDKNAPLIREIALSISSSCPKASIAIATEPINSVVPMVSEILKKYGHYNPSSVFGVTTLDVVRANKFVAEVQGVEPECVMVPVIGGHYGPTIVPVLSQATPCADFTNDELEDITKSVREAHDNIIKLKPCDGPNLSTAFATARFVISLVKALRGQQEIVECAFVKSTAHPQLKYMATPLLLGPAGVMKNLGIPELSDYEQCLLENAIPLLNEEIKRGEILGGHKDKPICDVCDPDPKAPRCPPDHCALQSVLLGESKV